MKCPKGVQPLPWPRLDVPYVRQLEENACGAAALDMVYRFYEHPPIDQRAIFEALKEPEPNGTENFCMMAKSLEADARSRGFSAREIHFWPVNVELSLAMIDFYLAQGVPLIVCQRWPLNHLLGHYRVITGRNKKSVFANDPAASPIGGRDREYRIEEFVEAWMATGPCVVGGGAVIIMPPGGQVITPPSFASHGV